MNSLNQKTSDKMTPPIAEFPDQSIKFGDGKIWNNKSDATKDTGSMNLENSSSPKMDSLVETIPSPVPLQKFRQSGFHGKRHKLDDEYDSIEMACHLASEIADDCDIFGKSVAAQLRQMSRMQKFIAQRLISEVCFRGQIQILQTNTTFANQQPAYQTQQMPVYPVRPPHLNPGFGRGPEYIVVHQTSAATRHTNQIASATPSQSYPNYVHLQQQQQSDHSAPNMNHIEDHFGVN